MRPLRSLRSLRATWRWLGHGRDPRTPEANVATTLDDWMRLIQERLAMCVMCAPVGWFLYAMYVGDDRSFNVLASGLVFLVLWPFMTLVPLAWAGLRLVLRLFDALSTAIAPTRREP